MESSTSEVGLIIKTNFLSPPCHARTVPITELYILDRDFAAIFEAKLTCTRRHLLPLRTRLTPFCEELMLHLALRRNVTPD